MKDFAAFDFGVDISMSTISRRRLNKLYTMKQVRVRMLCFPLCAVLTAAFAYFLYVRVEPSMCNSDINKVKRKAFADKIVQHQDAGDYIVHYNETNFNLYCKRTQGKAVKGERATLELPPSKGANLQIQRTMSVADGVVLHHLERGSIKMQQNTDYVEALYHTAKETIGYQQHYH